MEIRTPQRYHRQVILPEIGPQGQERLANASVLVVGVGGLGTPVATYLAATGVGRLGLIDADTVDETNLHRQILYGTDDIGKVKVDVAADRLRALNPNTDVVTHRMRLDEGNALSLVQGYDVVVDGTDTFTTRYLVNDAAVLSGTPNVFASISRFDGQASVFRTPDGPCYRCLFPAPPPAGLVPNCAEGGVVGVLPGLLGTIQATETIKVLLGIGEPLVGRLLLVDALRMEFRELRFDRDPACPVCGDHPTITHVLPTRPMASVPETTVRQLKDRIDAGDRPFILDVREPDEYEGANIGGALIPLGELPERLDEIKARQDEDVVVHCRSGGRSTKAVEYLRANGFDKAVNLKGGIHAWSDEIDPSLPKV